MDSELLADLLESYRAYLKSIATSRLQGQLARRISASDVVQEAMLAAHRDYKGFRGTTRAELVAWLRSILSNKLLTLLERHLSKKRDVRREVPMDAPTESDNDYQPRITGMLAAREPTPSAVFAVGEDVELVVALIGQLPAHYAEVIVLRNLKGMRFEAIAEKLGKTAQATRLLWLRAIKKLRKLYDQRQA